MLHRKNNNGYIIHQQSYENNLQDLNTDSHFQYFKSPRSKLIWSTNTRPDICATVYILPQRTPESFWSKHIRVLNKAIQKNKKAPKQGLEMQPLDEKTPHLKFYRDSSFSNNRNLSSQLAYIVLLCNKSGKCNILHYISQKCRRVVRSIPGGEIYAFEDAFDYANATKYDWETMLRKRVPLQMFTGSKSLFDIITTCSSTTEKRLQFDVQVSGKRTKDLKYQISESSDQKTTAQIPSQSSTLTIVQK